MIGNPISAVAISAAIGVGGVGFALSPTVAHAVGTLALAATGAGTSWGVSNPFSIVSGPADGLASYVNINSESATFTINVTAINDTPIVIADSDSGTEQSIITFFDVPAYRTHTIAGTADGAQTDFQMRFIVHKASGTNSGEDVYLNTNVEDDFDDVRFKTSDGVTTLAHWKDESTLVSGSICVFWVKIPSIPIAAGTTTIRIYYGDSALPDVSDIQATMLGGDDFSTMRRTSQIASGAAPSWATGVFKEDNGGIVFPVWDSTDLDHVLYRSSDGGLSAASVSTIYSASSDRTHSNIDGDGVNKLYVMTKKADGTSIHLKKSANAGATWGSEINIATSITGATDPTPLYISGSLTLCFVRVTSGTDFLIRCYQSTDDGDTWSLRSTPLTVAQAGLNSIEDIAACITSTGRILLTWEKEATEQGSAQCDSKFSDDNGTTWGSLVTIVNDGAGVDDEGGTPIRAPTGTDLHYIYGSNAAGGVSYQRQQTYRKISTDNGATWGAAVMVNESYAAVENNGVYNDDGDFVLFGTRQYDGGGAGDTTTYTLTMTVLDGHDWADRGWTQDDGLAYVTRFSDTNSGAWVEANTPTTALRGFLSFDDYSGGDAVIEALLRAPTPLTEANPRIVFRYTDKNNHYMLTLLGASTNQVQWFERTAGTYAAALHTGSFTAAVNTDYRVISTLRGTNPTTLTVTVNGNTILNAVTESTSTHTTGKIGISATTTAAQRATFCKHIFARKFVATEPTHGAWSTETSVQSAAVRAQHLYRLRRAA